MGMLQNGQWTANEALTVDGAYVRPPSRYAEPVGERTIRAIAADPGRCHLIASESCPWSHRTLIVRRLKGLEAQIPVHIAWGPRVEGYAANGGMPWAVPGTERAILHLHELYSLGDPAYTGRSTVPVLWDSRSRRIVSNESAAIMRALDAVQAPGSGLDFTLTPVDRLPGIDALNARVYDGLSNGVYRARFAETRAAYEPAVGDVFATLEWLDARLADRRYLTGSTITEADWRLFPTLFRFDAIYYVLHRCAQRRLVDFPHLWAYARDLYAWRGIAGAVTLAAMQQAGYLSETDRADAIIAVAPGTDWCAPHGREALGTARVALRGGGDVEVVPSSLRP